MNKLFDLKFVIGIFFLVLGLLLILYALFTAGPVADGKKINLFCGLIMSGFGGFMMLLPGIKDKSK
jgi:hypothetical protein